MIGFGISRLNDEYIMGFDAHACTRQARLHEVLLYGFRVQSFDDLG